MANMPSEEIEYRDLSLSLNYHLVLQALDRALYLLLCIDLDFTDKNVPNPSASHNFEKMVFDRIAKINPMRMDKIIAICGSKKQCKKDLNNFTENFQKLRYFNKSLKPAFFQHIHRRGVSYSVKPRFQSLIYILNYLSQEIYAWISNWENHNGEIIIFHEYRV